MPRESENILRWNYQYEFDDGAPCCTGGDCCGPGSYCCARTGPHTHDEEI